jgi:competence protein ComK
LAKRGGKSMYEIDLSTLMLIGIDNNKTKVVTKDNDLIVEQSAKKIIDTSCKYFGCSLADRIKFTKRYVNMNSKSPIIIEDTRNIIFFPLKSPRENNNIWISFNNLKSYVKEGNKTNLIFKNGKKVPLEFSYYIIDNQVTRSLILDYEIKVRRKNLK